MIDWPKVVQDLEAENARLKKDLAARQWVGLKYKEANEIACNFMNLGGDIPDWVSFYRAIEAKLKERNT